MVTPARLRGDGGIRPPGKSLFHRVPAAERLSLAKARADKLVHHIAPLFLMHEANAVIIYSQQLSEQIPRSYAAHAFNQFQVSMHLFEVMRLCAIWDKPSPDRESIPSIIALFNEPKLIDQLINEIRGSYVDEPPPADFHDGDDAQEIAAKESLVEARPRDSRSASRRSHTRSALIRRQQSRRDSSVITAESPRRLPGPLHRP